MKKSIFNSLLFGFVSCLAVSVVSAEGASQKGLSPQGFYAEQAYIRAMPPGQEVTAAFLKLVNNSDRACKVTGGSSPIATDIQIHEHRHSDGMMKMRQVEEIEINANDSTTLRPGSFHVMFLGLKSPLVEGESVKLNLYFDNGDEVMIDAPIKKITSKKKMKHN